MRALYLFLALLPSLSQAQLSQQVADLQQQYELLGGTVVTFCADGIQQSIPFGTANLELNHPVDDSTYFRIASISKTITALAVLQLRENGQLALTDDIGDLLGYSVRNPNFPDAAITVGQLLTHQSGIVDGSTYGDFLGATYGGNSVPNLSELLSETGTYYSSSTFNNLEPGSYFNYSNLNYGILGTLLEAVSGQRFDVYVRQHLLQPMGITGSFLVNDLPDLDRLAVLYRKPNGIWTPQSDDLNGVAPDTTNLIGYLPGTNALRFAPQGGLRVTGPELAQIFRMLLNGGEYDGTQILQSATVDLLSAPHWNYNGSNGNNYYGLFRSWGYGVHRSTDTPNADLVLPDYPGMLGHPGEAYGLISDAYIDRENGFGFVFLTNGSGTGYTTNSNSAFYTVERALFDALNTVDWATTCLVATKSPAKLRPLSFSPNPASELVRVQGATDTILTVYGTNGSLLRTERLHSPQSFSVATWAAGSYFVRIGDAGGWLVVQ